MSGIYLDISKDRLYCDDKNSVSRRASQSAMAMITKSLLGLIAPILTYTMNEVIENAPKILKDDKNTVFDFEYESLPSVESSFDENYMIEVKEKFSEIVDKMKKEKKIKSTLELSLFSDSAKLKELNITDVEDWFLVSEVFSDCNDEGIASFKVGDDNFRVLMSSKAKCPRCWKLKSDSE